MHQSIAYGRSCSLRISVEHIKTLVSIYWNVIMLYTLFCLCFEHCLWYVYLWHPSYVSTLFSDANMRCIGFLSKTGCDKFDHISQSCHFLQESPQNSWKLTRNPTLFKSIPILVHFSSFKPLSCSIIKPSVPRWVFNVLALVFL